MQLCRLQCSGFMIYRAAKIESLQHAHISAVKKHRIACLTHSGEGFLQANVHLPLLLDSLVTKFMNWAQFSPVQSTNRQELLQKAVVHAL